MTTEEQDQFKTWLANLPQVLRDKPLWEYADLSNFTGKPVATLRGDKMRGNGPRAVKIGQLVRFDQRDVFTWLESLREAA